MENISFIDKINVFTEEQKADVIEKFVEFLKEYTEPSFGSISKRDINIKIFNIMRDLGLISENPDAWEIINKLKLTRTNSSGHDIRSVGRIIGMTIRPVCSAQN